jgi:zinc transport system substrate-binding protein
MRDEWGRIWRVLCCTWLVLSIGCGRGGGGGGEGGAGEAGGASGGAPIPVVVSILPQRQVVERIGGERVEVEVMVGVGASPETYEPKPSQLRALSGARAYFAMGVPFEAGWGERFRRVNPLLRMVDVNEGVERLELAGHVHGDGDHVHEQEATWDPHTWVSPRRVIVQARHVAAVLAELAPAHEAEFRANLEGLVADIEALDAGLRERLDGLAGRPFLVFHPAWGYFADDYGLVQIPIEVGGQEPSAAEMAEVIRRARAEGVRAVFVQPESGMQQARQVASALGCEVVEMSPLAPDWLENLREVGERLAAALRQGGPDE